MNKLPTLLKEKWREYLLELFVVTFGILLAFFLSTWNETRKDRIQEQEILLGLKKEFQENLTGISIKIGINKNVISSCYRLIEILRSDNRISFSEEIDSLVALVMYFASFDAHSGSIDETIASGKLSILKDKELRSRLTGWSGKLQNMVENYDLRTQFFTNVLAPELMKYFVLINSDVYMQVSKDSRSLQLAEGRVQEYLSDLDKYSLLQLENGIVLHKINQDFVVLFESQLYTFLEETLEVIERNIK